MVLSRMKEKGMMMTGGTSIMKLLLGDCWIFLKGQLCVHFLHGALWQVGTWQGRQSISLFINPCLLTPTLTAAMTPTVALALWVVHFPPQSKTTRITLTYYRIVKWQQSQRTWTLVQNGRNRTSSVIQQIMSNLIEYNKHLCYQMQKIRIRAPLWWHQFWQWQNIFLLKGQDI